MKTRNFKGARRAVHYPTIKERKEKRNFNNHFFLPFIALPMPPDMAITHRRAPIRNEIHDGVWRVKKARSGRLLDAAGALRPL